MYWICFGDSAKGCLTEACRSLDVEMKAEHILALSDDYSQGDIRDVTDRAARADIVTPWRGDPELDGAWQTEYQARHWEVIDRLDEVDEAVIWYAGGNALEQCGLRYVVSRLYQKQIPIWAAEVGWIPAREVALANKRVRSTSVVGVITDSRVTNALLRLMPQCILRRYAAWIEQRSLQKRVEQSPREGMACFSTVGEMSPNIVPYFYKRRRQLTQTEQAALLTEWKRMQEENAPLRAMVDGKVQSVSEDFYDEIILSCVPEEEKSRAALTVGRALAKLDEAGNRVSDMLIFSRVRALGAAGRLTVVQDGATYRDMVIRKNRG
ncbi:DUF3658 domain-containing protein [uncultured Agathobaculum sp.]|uniref:DUF3658 domain-containing protein n=1 Tax=uncultured Agathobaculum sp. TaxID=2048140 RepID=UPI0032095A9B